MKKIFLLLVGVALCVSVSACTNNTIISPSPEATMTESNTDIQTGENDTMNDYLATDVNTDFISYVDKPFSYFSEMFGWEFEDLEMFGEGPPVGEYTYNDIKYTFNNRLGYDELTMQTPCTSVSLPYTVLLPGIESQTLTKENLIEIFGGYSDEYLSYGFIDTAYNENVLRFQVDGDGQFTPYTIITMS